MRSRIKDLARKGKETLQATAGRPESMQVSEDQVSSEYSSNTTTVAPSSYTNLSKTPQATENPTKADLPDRTKDVFNRSTVPDVSEPIKPYNSAAIWAEAYEKAKEDPDNFKLVTNMELYLTTKTDADDGTNDDLTTGDDMGRLKLVQEIAEDKLEDIPGARLSFQIRDRPIVVRQGVVKAIRVVNAFKPIISGAVAAEPHAALAWAGISTVLPILENVFQQDEDAANGLINIIFLMIRYQQLYEPGFASEFTDSGHHSESTRQLLSRIRTELIDIYAQVYLYQARFILQYATRGRAHRALRNALAADGWKELWKSIETTSQRIDQAVHDRIGTRTLDMWREVNDISVNVQKIETLQQEILESLKEIDQRQLLQSLNVTADATFDSRKTWSVEVPCLPGTQQRILKEIQDWTENSDSKPILWLEGMAGTGKTSISLTVAQALHERQSFTNGTPKPNSAFLGATFFFKQGDVTRNNTSEFFTTIAQCLASSLPDLKIHIADAIDNNSGIETKGPRQQLKELILGPLSLLDEKAFVPLRPIVVVDALDECVDKDAEALLGMLANIGDLGQVQLRFLFTSRGKAHISRGFRSLPDDLYCPMTLEKIESTSEEQQPNDISLYISHTMGEIAKKNGVHADWISQAEIRRLTDKANGLFIYAATACRFLDSDYFTDQGYRDEQLELIFNDEWETEGPQQTLDSIYTKVLEFADMKTSHKSLRDRVYSSISKILGFIAVLFRPVSVVTLSELLPMKRDQLNGILKQLHSIVSVPVDETSPIVIVHLSFRDFILSEQRSRGLPFRVEDVPMHRELLDRCLQTMSSSLRQDICDLSLPGALASEVSSSQIETCIPPYMRYGCQYWVDHLAKICENHTYTIESFNVGQVDLFLQEKFLFWLEVMSLIKEVSSVVPIINKLQNLIKPFEQVVLSDFVYDAKRFIQSNRWILEKRPLQIYCSALLFSPKKSVVRTQFEHLIPEWILKKPDTVDDWDLEVLTLRGHEEHIISIAFSPAHDLIASASFDNTTRIWDYVTGSERHVFQEPEQVLSVAFSSDGMKVAVGGYGGLLRVRDHERATQNDLGCSSKVREIVFSPTSNNILASLSDGGKLQIWNVDDMQLLFTHDAGTEDPEAYVEGLSFSSDGQFVATGSESGLVTLWKLDEAEPAATVHTGGKTHGIAFSQDSGIMAVGHDLPTRPPDWADFWDPQTIDFWHVTSPKPKLLRTFPILGTTSGLCFLPPDGQILSYKDSGEGIVLQKWATGDAMINFCPASNLGSSYTAWSRDGTLLAMVDNIDWVIRLYATPTDSKELEEALPTSSVEFLSDDRAVTYSVKSPTKRWKLVDGSVETVCGPVESIQHSPDRQLILLRLNSGHEFQIWDSNMGCCLQTFQDMVGMDFVPGRNCIASLSVSGEIRLLDTVSFEETFKVQLNDVTLPRRSKIKDGSVATVRLSPDGQLAVLHFDKGSRAGWGSPCQLWDLTKNEELALVFVDMVYAVTFSSEGNLVTVDALKLCPCTYIFDTATGETLQHLEWMNGLTFHPSENMFALIASDTNIAVWETAPLHEQFRLEADQNVEKLAISPTGKLAAVLPNEGGATSMVHLWDLSTRQMLGKCEINGGLSSLWFPTKGNFLGSNRGRLPLPVAPIEVGEEMIEQDLQSCFYILNGWVFQGRERLIWLPQSYQVLDEDRVDVSQVDVRGNTIAFAHSGDSLKFIQIDLDNTPVAKSYKRKL
ncbi:hypothetical protein NW756_009737 [Fusarium oxysporum]|nr:hypothetical protein NW763_012622 [Fusarium oxysporum]KAJ4045274.1 hypothetical protein NW753_009915 [Fusarium oxysporum]KAJ4083536.1 hypothetical protein NW756_009737 [Fusarium oxysporum]